ncbi:MAG: hypothetical protein WDZ80_01420 [Candidatus Paceibacterota bacterium]
MFKKIKSYFRFWNDKPIYHVEGSVYGGLRMDIDKYYSIEENRRELEEINNSFGKIFRNGKTKKKGSSTVT